MPDPMQATVTGTPSNDPPKPQVLAAFAAGVQVVESAGGGIRFNGARLARGARENLVALIQLFRRVPLYSLPPNRLRLYVNADDALSPPAAAQQVKGRMANLRKAVVATQLLTADLYSIAPGPRPEDPPPAP